MIKSIHVEERNIDQVWFRLLIELCNYGRINEINTGSFEEGDIRLEFDFVSGTILRPIEYTDSGERLPLAVTVPPGCPAPTDEHKIAQYYATYLKDSHKTDNEDYRYATWLVGGEYRIPEIQLIHDEDWMNGQTAIDFYANHKVMVPNQLQWCINHWKNKGLFNNHCCILVGYPESTMAYDVPYDNPTERRTSPCLRVVDMKVIKDIDDLYLTMFVYFRSWDLYNGFPENIGGLSLLLEEVAMELEVKPGPLSFASKGLHVYGHALSALAQRAGHNELLESYINRTKGI